MKKIWKRVLSLVLAVAMIAGIVTIDGSKEVKAAEEARAVAFDFQEASGISWYFGHTSLPAAYQGKDDWSVKVSYEFDAYKDGASTPEKVRIEFVGSTAYIWGELHYTDKTIPTTSLYVPEGTIMYECTYDEASHTNSLVDGGKQLVLSEELKMVCKDGVWSQNKILGVSVSFREIDSAGNWLFNHSELPYEYRGDDDWNNNVAYRFKGYMDDSTELETGWLQMVGSTMYIYRGAFPGGNPPTTKFRIPMGTILEELTPEAGDPSGGTLIPEGKRIRFSADFIMTKDASGNWKQQDAPDSEYDFINDGVTDYKIVLPANPTANEQYAADELQYFIEEATGVRILFHREGTGTLPEKFVSLGDTQVSRDAGVTPTYEELKTNGFVIKTIEDDCYIKGYGDMGTRNGAYEFLSYCFDYECYAPDSIQLTQTTSRKLPMFQVTKVPDFEFREASSETALDAQGAYRMQYNTSEEIFVTGHSCHNTYTIIDPERDYLYTDSRYKDWYSEATTTHNQRGQRVLPAQLCFSNEEVKTEFLKNLKTFLAANRNGQPSMMIGMEDNNLWCTCSACTASKNKYGTNAATMIKFINFLQEELNEWYAEEYPDEVPVQLVMFAYHQSEEPPVEWDNELGDYAPIDESVRLHEDVGVMYAPVRASYAYDFNDPINARFKRQVEGWDALTGDLYMWTYGIYTQNMFLYMDTFHILEANYSFFKSCGSRFMFDMIGGYNQNGNGGWERARNYVMSRLMWDIDQDIDMLLDDFFEFYFDDAADIMRNLMNENSQYIKDNVWTKLDYVEPTDDNYGSVQGNVFVQIPSLHGKDVYFTESYLNGALDQIDDAYAAIEKYKFTDPDKYWDLYEHINMESLQFRYILIRWHKDPNTYSKTQYEYRWEFRRDYENLGIIGATDFWTGINLFGDLWGMPTEGKDNERKLVYNGVNITYADIASDGKLYLQGEIVSGPDKGKTLASVYGKNVTGSGKLSYYMDGKTITEENVWTVTNADSSHGNSTLCVGTTDHLSSNMSKVSSIMLKEGEIIVVGANTPFQILNDVNVANADGTWTEYNDVELTYTYNQNGVQYLNAQIVSGPDTGKTMGEAYGDWASSAVGDISYTINGETKKNQSVTFGIFAESMWNYNSNLQLQNDDVIVGYRDGSLTQISIEEGTIFAVDGKRALRIASDFQLERNPGEAWEMEYNVVKLSYDSHAFYNDGNRVGIYLNAEIVSGPDEGRLIDKVYGSWANPPAVGDMTYQRGGNQATDPVLYSVCENGGKSQIYISGEFVASDLEMVQFYKGTVVIPTRLDATRTPIMIANNLKIARTDDGFTDENQIAVTYKSFDGRGFYMTAEITDGPDKGAKLTDVYGDWKSSGVAKATVYRNSEPEQMDVVLDACSFDGNGSIYLSGNYAEYMNQVTEIRLAKDTVVNPKISDYSSNPYRLTNDIRVVNRQIAASNDETNTFFSTDMLEVMVQDTYDKAAAGATEYDMRFCGSVDVLEYRHAGFVFSLANENPTKDGAKCTSREVGKVYNRIQNGVIGGRVTAGQLYGGNSKYLYAFEITGVPAETMIYVRAYVELYDGTIVYGTTRAVTAPGVKPAA